MWPKLNNDLFNLIFYHLQRGCSVTFNLSKILKTFHHRATQQKNTTIAIIKRDTCEWLIKIIIPSVSLGRETQKRLIVLYEERCISTQHLRSHFGGISHYENVYTRFTTIERARARETEARNKNPLNAWVIMAEKRVNTIERRHKFEARLSRVRREVLSTESRGVAIRESQVHRSRAERYLESFRRCWILFVKLLTINFWKIIGECSRTLGDK